MHNIPKEYLDSAFDFGFTAVDEETVVEPSVNNAQASVEEKYKQKLQDVEKLIMPLLVNLMKNGDKDYIHWPKRVPMIEGQIQKILTITRGE